MPSTKSSSGSGASVAAARVATLGAAVAWAAASAGAQGQWTERLQGQLWGSHSSATDVGDCDRDGDPDFLIWNSLLFRNDGSGRAEPQPIAWASTFQAWFFADVDGDGDIDVIGNDFVGMPRLIVQRNLGGGTYAPSAPLPLPARQLLAFDADSDGDQDILLGGMRLLHNDGTGAFTLDPIASPAGAACTVAAAADFDGDGDLDILAADTRLHMFVNDGAGTLTWTPTRLGVIPGQSGAVDILPFDADGDGDVDAFVSQTHSVPDAPLLLLRNIGGGTLVLTTGLLPANQSGRSHADAGDIDADGDIDVVVYTSTGLRHWSNDGSGRMLDAGLIRNDSTLQGFPVVLSDIDGDLDLDVVIQNRIFVNRRWHAEAPQLALPGTNYVVEFGGTAMPNGVAVPFLGLRARWPLPPFGTLGIDFGSASPLPLVPVAAGVGTLSIPVPFSLSGLQFGVQAALLDGIGYHLTPVVYGRVF